MADTVVPGGGFDPQMLNRYSYVRNNPLRYVDPSGHQLGSPDRPDLKEVGSKVQHDWSSGRSERGDDGKAHTTWEMTQQRKPSILNKLFGWDFYYSEYTFGYTDTNSGFKYRSGPFKSSYGFDVVNDFMVSGSKLAVEKLKYFSSRMARGVGHSIWGLGVSLYSNKNLHIGTLYGFNQSAKISVGALAFEIIKSSTIYGLNAVSSLSAGTVMLGNPTMEALVDGLGPTPPATLTGAGIYVFDTYIKEPLADWMSSGWDGCSF